MGWKRDLPDYLVSRVAQHGRRRAAEMREVAEALRDVEFEPLMALATAKRQDWLVDEMAKAGTSHTKRSHFRGPRLPTGCERSRNECRVRSGGRHHGELKGSTIGG